MGIEERQLYLLYLQFIYWVEIDVLTCIHRLVSINSNFRQHIIALMLKRLVYTHRYSVERCLSLLPRIACDLLSDCVDFAEVLF